MSHPANYLGKDFMNELRERYVAAKQSPVLSTEGNEWIIRIANMY